MRQTITIPFLSEYLETIDPNLVFMLFALAVAVALSVLACRAVRRHSRDVVSLLLLAFLSEAVSLGYFTGMLTVDRLLPWDFIPTAGNIVCLIYFALLYVVLFIASFAKANDQERRDLIWRPSWRPLKRAVMWHATLNGASTLSVTALILFFSIISGLKLSVFGLMLLLCLNSALSFCLGYTYRAFIHPPAYSWSMHPKYKGGDGLLADLCRLMEPYEDDEEDGEEED